MAQATALIWIATATYRDSSDVFVAYRDSVLASHDLSEKRVEAFTSRFGEDPEKYAEYLRRVTKLVDSLADDRLDVVYDSANYPSRLFKQ